MKAIKTNRGAPKMTNKQLAALIKAIDIIVKLSNDKNNIHKYLQEISSELKERPSTDTAANGQEQTN